MAINPNEDVTSAMLAALLRCPEPQRLDTLVAVLQVYIELGVKGPAREEGGE